MAGPFRARTKTEAIHALLRAEILGLAHPPGTYLNVDELARRHGLSPIPVREAVARLVAEGLVTLRPHVGAAVAMVDAQSVRELFAVLTGLEVAAAGDSAVRARPADIVRLAALQGELEALRLPRDLAEWDRVNASFHRELAALAGLPGLDERLAVAFEHWDRARRHLFEAASVADDGALALREHRAMLAALRRRDAPRLRALLCAHNERARDRYLGRLGAA